MIVVAQRGDRCDAEVTAIYPGKSVEMRLESGESAFMLWRGLAGETESDQLERGIGLRLGSPLWVDVIDVFPGRDLKNKILVREVDWTPKRSPHNKRRKNPRRGRSNGGTHHTTRDGIRVWRAS